MKAVLREQKLPFEVRTNTFDEKVFEKLKEAEVEMSNTERYSKEEVLESMNNIIG